MKSFKRLRRLALITLVFVFAYWGIVFANDRIALSLKEMLVDHPLPPGTQLVDSKAVAGKMAGNGNGMQYFGMILVKTELSEEDLEAYYREKLETEYYLYVEKQESQLIWPYKDYRFENWEDGDDSYCITLYRDSVVGLEDSLWEAILNSDLRAH